MKQTIEEAVRKYADDKCQERGVPKKYRLHFDFDRYDIEQGFKAGAEWQAKQAIEILSSVLENWVHGGDADCIIAEFEEKLKNNV